MNNEISRVLKVLSRNDTGETHSHQSGISIPRQVMSSGIFPYLGTDVLNPRCSVSFFDEEGRKWDFQFIYYNDKYHGKPANKCHDEFRLTCVKEFLSAMRAKAGDRIWFSVVGGRRCVGIEHGASGGTTEPAACSDDGRRLVIRISPQSTWRFETVSD